MGPMNKGQFRFSIWYFILAIVGLMVLNALIMGPRIAEAVDYSEFRDLVESGVIRRVELGPTHYTGFTVTRAEAAELQQQGRTDRIRILQTARVEDPELIGLLEEHDVEYYAVPEHERPLLTFLLSWVLPFVVLFFFWRLMFNRIGRTGPDVLSFGRNRARIVAEGDTGTRFADVAGSDEAKAELEEVVGFLKTPERYAAIGGRVPKGVLMVGAPGTGKTLLARAVAGEAGVPFFRMSGADFVEMFVGVGAARVRDLFRQAREKAPCIIFIDELDAIGKSRVHSASSNDEREQTLNQLLVEMDGFDARSGVIVLAATNRPETLDPALMRAGRFDRQVLLNRPDAGEREAILRKHAENVKLDASVDLSAIARATPGLVGADLANVINEAALLAVRAGRTTVTQPDLEEAIEKAVAGLKKKNRLIDPAERRRVAFHEAGHAIASLLTPGADPVRKVSIVPRGLGALGYTLQLPTEERYLLTEQDLLGRIDVLLAGRAAEELVFGDISTGAADDLSKASDIVRRMITEYGMSVRFRHVYLPYRRSGDYLGGGVDLSSREYSEATQQYVDQETARMLADRYDRVTALLDRNRSLLTTLAEQLLERETLDRNDLERLLGAADRELRRPCLRPLEQRERHHDPDERESQHEHEQRAVGTEAGEQHAGRHAAHERPHAVGGVHDAVVARVVSGAEEQRRRRGGDCEPTAEHEPEDPEAGEERQRHSARREVRDGGCDRDHDEREDDGAAHAKGVRDAAEDRAAHAVEDAEGGDRGGGDGCAESRDILSERGGHSDGR
jgi:cell division protease FtsH